MADYYVGCGAFAIYAGTLKKLPKHGRLIDVDTLGMTDFEIVMCNGDYKELAKMILEKIENAPTVIPASEEA